MAKKPLYIQHEPGAYPKDIDWQMMTAEERGCYHSLIIFLACSDGYIPNEPESLCGLCNINIEKLKSFLKKYSHKFMIKDGKLSHKRVNEELAKARKSIRQKSLAGKKGMQRRYNTVITPTPKTDITKEREVKGSKVKGSINKDSVVFDFENARKKYPGTKRGYTAEFANYKKKHPDWKDQLDLLLPAIQKQIEWRKTDSWRPPWKNFRNWLADREWEVTLTVSAEAKEKDCIGCGAAYAEGHKFGLVGRTRKKEYRCTKCREALK